MSTRARWRARVGTTGAGLDFPDVGRLKTLWAARHLELDSVALRQALEAVALDGAVVDEDVLTAVLRDEPVALRIVEPLYSTLCHTADLSLGVFSPCVLPPRWWGCRPQAGGKQKRRANWISRGVSFGLYSPLPEQSGLNQNRRQFYTDGAARQSNSMGRVTGLEPFLVPSQPGMATENRPAVPPATITWISSGDGNLGTRASRAGGDAP